jgi:hypothetical protein
LDTIRHSNYFPEIFFRATLLFPTYFTVLPETTTGVLTFLALLFVGTQ